MWPPVDTDGSLIRGFKCAFVVFEKASGCRAVTAALEKNATEEPLVLSTPERPVATGLKKWKREYNARYMLSKQVIFYHTRLKAVGRVGQDGASELWSENSGIILSLLKSALSAHC